MADDYSDVAEPVKVAKDDYSDIAEPVEKKDFSPTEFMLKNPGLALKVLNVVRSGTTAKPIIDPEAAKNLIPDLGVLPGTGVNTGVLRSILKNLAGQSSLEGGAMATALPTVLGATPSIVQRLASLGFSLDMAHTLGGQLGEASVNPTAENVTDAAITGGLTTLTGLHAALPSAPQPSLPNQPQPPKLPTPEPSLAEQVDSNVPVNEVSGAEQQPQQQPNAVQEQSPQSGLTSDVDDISQANGKSSTNQDIVQTGSQAQPGVNRTPTPNDVAAATRGLKEATDAWNQAYRRNNQEASSDSEAALARAAAARWGAERILADINERRISLRTQDGGGTNAGSQANQGGMRSPQESGQAGQQTGESSGNDQFGAQETSLAGNVSRGPRGALSENGGSISEEGRETSGQISDEEARALGERHTYQPSFVKELSGLSHDELDKRLQDSLDDVSYLKASGADEDTIKAEMDKVGLYDALAQKAAIREFEPAEPKGASTVADKALKHDYSEVAGPALPETPKEGETSSNEPETPLSQASERARYDEIQERISQLTKDKNVIDPKTGEYTDEITRLWKENEDIKNRNEGMPPGEKSGQPLPDEDIQPNPANQGPEQLSEAGSPVNADEVQDAAPSGTEAEGLQRGDSELPPVAEPAKTSGSEVAPPKLSKEAGVARNPFARMKSPPTNVLYIRHPNGLYEVLGLAARKVRAGETDPLLSSSSQQLHLTGKTILELKNLLPPRVYEMIRRGAGNDVEGTGGGKEINPTSYDWGSQFGESGHIYDPTNDIQKAIDTGAELIGLGAKKFSDFARHMQDEFGDKIVPQLQDIFQKSGAIAASHESQGTDETATPKTGGEGPPAPKAKPAKDSTRFGQTYKKRVAADIVQSVKRAIGSPTVDVASKREIRSSLADIAGGNFDSLRSALKSTSEWPISALENLRDRVQLLEKLGRGVVKDRQAIYDSEKNLRESQIANDAPKAQAINDIPKKVSPGERLPLPEKLKQTFDNKMAAAFNWAMRNGRSLLPRDVVHDILDGNQNYNGALSRVIGGALDSGHNVEYNLIDKWASPLREIVKRNKLDSTDLEQAYIAAASDMEGGYQRLIDSGMKPGSLEKIIDNLSPGQKEYIAAARHLFDEETYPAVAKLAHDLYNIDVKKVDNYVPLQRDYELHDAKPGSPESLGADEHGFDEMATLRQLQPDFMPGPSTKVNRGFIKERVDEARGGVKVNFGDVVDRHIKQAAHLVAQQRSLKMLGELVRDPSFREQYGKWGQRYNLDLLDSVSRDAAPIGSTRSQLLDFYLKNNAVAILGWRLISQFKHFPNLIISFRNVRPDYLLSGLAESGTKAAEAAVKRTAGEITQRYGGEESIKELAEGKGLADRFRAFSFIAERLLDQKIAAGTYIGALKENLAKAGKDPESWKSIPANSEEARKALVISRMSTTSPLRKDQPQAISRGTITGGQMSYTRALFQFGQTMLRQQAIMKHDIYDYGKQGLQTKDAGKVMGAAATGLAFLALIASETGINEASRHLLGAPPKKGENANFAEQMALEAMHRITGGQQMQAAVGYGDTGVAAIDTVVKGAQSIGQMVKGKNEFGKPMTYDQRRINLANVGGFAGSLAGIPGSATLAQFQRNSILRQQAYQRALSGK